MLEGLEISIINFTDFNSTYRKRLDSTYYLKDFINNEKYLVGKKIETYIEKRKVLNVKSLSLLKPFNYVAIADISLHSLSYTCRKVSHSLIPDRATYVLKHNDIVVSTVRPNRNAVALISNPNRLVGTSGFTVLRLDTKVVIPISE